MDKLKAMEVFVRIVDGGSLTAAADALEQSPASVVRTLAALESELGARLLNRSTRRLALTEEGREYLERCRRILADVDDAQASLKARGPRPSGSLRITAPVVFGRRHVTPVVTSYLFDQPDMQVELLLLDRVVDLLEEGLDLAVRIGRMADSSLVAIPLGETREIICASPEYLQRCGEPKHPAELQHHACANFTPQGRQWAYQDQAARRVVNPALRLSTNHIESAIGAACDGLGCTRLLHYQLAEHLAAGRLVRILRDYELPALPIQLVYPHSRLLSLRVRSFIDWAAPRLRSALAAAD